MLLLLQVTNSVSLLLKIIIIVISVYWYCYECSSLFLKINEIYSYFNAFLLFSLYHFSLLIFIFILFSGDMRSSRPVEQADILVSELLGE